MSSELSGVRSVVHGKVDSSFVYKGVPYSHVVRLAVAEPEASRSACRDHAALAPRVVRLRSHSRWDRPPVVCRPQPRSLVSRFRARHRARVRRTAGTSEPNVVIPRVVSRAHTACSRSRTSAAARLCTGVLARRTVAFDSSNKRDAACRSDRSHATSTSRRTGRSASPRRRLPRRTRRARPA